MNNILLEVEGLTVRAPDGQCLVHDVALRLRNEERLGIAGESGSGKTITAKSILALLPDDLSLTARRLSLLGQNVSELPEAERLALLGMNVGFVPQNTVAYLHPLIKVKNQIADGYLYYRTDAPRAAMEKARYLLSKVGIADTLRVLNCYPGELSGGMRQRVNIAMALMCDPKLIIADEPTTALDTVVQRQVMDLFMRINADRHVALIMISHDLGLIRRYCERVVVMYAGNVVEEGPSGTVLKDPLHPYTRSLISVIPGIGRDPSVRLQEIPGRVPETGRDAGGCMFYDRCAVRTQECLARVSLEAFLGNRLVSCARAKEGYNAAS